MLLLFPENLFIDGSIIGLAIIAAIAIILGGVGFWRLRKEKMAEA